MTEKLDDLIDSMFTIREQKRELEARKKDLDKELKALEAAYIARCKEIGTDYARGTLASATVTETVVPNIEDWGKVMEWMAENDGLYLVHRRVSSGPWKELQDAGIDVPGIEPFTKVGVSLSKLGN